MWIKDECCIDIAEINTVSLGDSALSSIFTTDSSNCFSDDFWFPDLENFQNRSSDPFFTATTEPSKASLDDVFPADIEISQNRSSDPVSVTTSKPNNASSDDFFSSDLQNSQNHRVFVPISIATTNRNNGNLQSRGSDPLSIANLLDRLGLLATVKNQANELFKKVKDKSRRRKRNALFAACVYIACRQTDMTFTVREISSVANGANRVEIFQEIRFIAQTLQLKHNHLMLIQAADFIKRFCFTLGMESQEVKAAQEAAESCKECDIRRSSVSIAAGIIYFIARFSHSKKILIHDISKVTGVSQRTLGSTVKDMNSHLSKIIPKWFATVKGPVKL